LNCPSCNAANEPGRKFCGECGARLALTCASCGSPNTPGQRFCGECGAPLTEALAVAPASTAAPLAPASAQQAERRLVSVMFADLVGFTTLSEVRDAEAVRDLLSRYFESASAIVQEYGGTVEKFIGDAVMAVWGTPTAHEDDAERSVRAALDLVDAVRRLGQEIDADLQLRAGVLSGEAAVTVGATNQGMVAGDLVNTASRLQSAAAPGTVLVGEATYRAASGAISFEPAGDRDLKGKAAPVAAYRALRVVAKRGGIGRSDQLEAPFVGRRAELRMLKDFHAATGEERRPRLVSIMGQGGIGKSRLVWEFQKYLDGVTEVAYWHYGRSPAYGEGITFWALAEMVRGRAGIAEGEDPADARAKLSATLDEFVTDADERRWIEPGLLQLLGLEEAAGTVRQRETLFAAWRTFFERIAEHGTVLLVFEDLQWADAGMLDFIDHVLDWSRDRPLYLITLARPELLDRRPDWGAGRRNFTSLLLDPLGDDDMRELLRGLVPGLPDNVATGILERAEGIPLYAVETVRMLLDEGRIERVGDGFRPVGDAQPLSIPATLQGLIAARLDGLDPADRSLLQAASVMGKTFSLDAAADVSGEDRETLAARLRSLVRRELLTLEADPRSPERGQYGFVQGLIREVAYGGLGRRDRRRLHLAAARHFETLGDEGIAGVLAEHYVAAYHAQPDGPEGDAVAAQARVALRGAAERAVSLGSYNQAASYFEQALEVTTGPAEQAQLHTAAGDAYRLSGATSERMLGHFRAALDLVSQTDNRARRLDATTDLGRATGWAGDSEPATAIMEQALADFADLDGTPEWVRLNTELSRVYMLLGRSAEALACGERVLPLAERLELRSEVLELLVTRGATLASVGRLEEAIVLLLGAVSQGRSLQLPGLELRARVNLSYATAAEDPQLSYSVAREGLELARHLGLRSQGNYLLNNASESAMQIGEWDWVTEQFSQAADGEHEDAPFAPRLLQARIAGFRGMESDGLLAEAAAFIAGHTEIQGFSMLDDVRSEVAMARGEFEESRRLAISSYERMSAPDSKARARAGRLSVWLHDGESVARILDEQRQVPGAMARISEIELQAGIAALAGRSRKAIGLFRDALMRLRSAGIRFELAVAALTMVYALGSDHSEVREAAAEAREIFTQLGATPLLALLDAAEAGTSPGRKSSPSAAEAATRVSSAGLRSPGG
jgi:class 3 adenylate cyclase/tetratricopeptide (TPR) repeat protein